MSRLPLAAALAFVLALAPLVSRAASPASTAASTSGATAQLHVWHLPEPVDRLVFFGPAVFAGRAPLLAAASGNVLYLARPGDAGATRLPFAPNDLYAGTWGGRPAVFCIGSGGLAVLPIDPMHPVQPEPLLRPALPGPDAVSAAPLPADAAPRDRAVAWRVADLDGDGASDLWGTDGRTLFAAIQEPSGRLVPLELPLAAPKKPVPSLHEVWRVSRDRAAWAVEAASSLSHRVWADDLYGDGRHEIVVLSEEEGRRSALVLKARPDGFTRLLSADLSSLGAAGDALLVDLYGDGDLEAARLRLLLPGEEGTILPRYVLDVFRLEPAPSVLSDGEGTPSPGVNMRAAKAPCLRLESSFLPGFMPLVRLRGGWAWLSLTPRLPATAGEMSRLAAGGTLELVAREARITAQGVRWEPGTAELCAPSMTDPRLVREGWLAADMGRAGLLDLDESGRLSALTPLGGAGLTADPGAVLAGVAHVDGTGRDAAVLLLDNGRTVESVAWQW
ncbi:hypothetical protein dsx2_3426 [Desulfovibrio sp. X2]|uniref:hypothetical protein n=1 Tax=Desulfovibrio sp. X2 TaxID=941449 RepID=UPI0003589AEC|nr:hypothetical protein [Desulfovibrio sp. X2]EPR39180.1 hypothetical protein dsx2_3426 [Desulfovibrio sp. X2]